MSWIAVVYYNLFMMTENYQNINVAWSDDLNPQHIYHYLSGQYRHQCSERKRTLQGHSHSDLCPTLPAGQPLYTQTGLCSERVCKREGEKLTVHRLFMSSSSPDAHLVQWLHNHQFSSDQDHESCFIALSHCVISMWCIQYKNKIKRNTLHPCGIIPMSQQTH